MTEPPITTFQCVVVLGFVLLAAFVTVTLVGLMEMQEPTDPYCEMRQIYIDSNGEYGWPDYRGNGECAR